MWRALLISVFLVTAATAQSPFFFSCAQDGEIDRGTRDRVEQAARAFLTAAQNFTPNELPSMMTETGRKAINADQLGVISKMLRDFKLSNVRVEHSFLVHVVGSGAKTAVCGSVADPAQRATLVLGDNAEQAFTVLLADAPNNVVAITFRLLPEKGKWLVNGFTFGAATLGDRDSSAVLEMARAEEQKGHRFNAGLLYEAAIEASVRGGYVRLGTADVAQEAAARLKVPAALSGNPPFHWSDGRANWEILSIGPMAIAGKLYVVINQKLSEWRSDNDADQSNKVLIQYFKHQFPEYRDVFCGVIARAHDPQIQHGFGTVEDSCSGEKK